MQLQTQSETCTKTEKVIQLLMTKNISVAWYILELCALLC